MEKQQIINAVRAELKLSKAITDADIEKLEGSFLWARIHFGLAFTELKEVLKKAFAF